MTAVGADDAVETIRRFVASRRWTFAKTMPHAPHEYTVRAWDPGGQANFEEAVRLIRQHGEVRTFGGRGYVYLDVDGWSYWTMGAPVGETTIVNRARP